jgi:HK97 gp10 family phage protein
MAKNIVTFKLDGVQDAINRLAKVGGQVAEDVEDELGAGANDIRASAARNISSQIQNTTRQMLGGLYVAQIGPLLFEVGNNVYYAPYVEFGTRRRVQVPEEMREIAEEIRKRPKRGNYEDMIDSLTQWLKKKGTAATQIDVVRSGKRKGQFKKASKLRQEIMLREQAKSIAYWINLNGIHPQPFLYPAYVENRSKIIERIKKIVEKPR